LLSSRYLAQARDLGIPPDREGEGLFQLGRTLFLSGQIPASRPVFEQALEAAPRHRSDILWLLTEAYLSDANPLYEQALAWNDKYLADRVLRPADRRRGLLQRARILLGLNQKDECLAALEEIPAEAKDQAEALVIKAGVIMATADEELAAEGLTLEQQHEIRKQYDEAIEVLQTAQGRDTLSSQASRKAMFLTAVCLLRKEDFTKALEQFAYTSRSNPETPESLAADFEMGELLRKLGDHQEALSAYSRALAQVNDPNDYSNPWISGNDLQRRTVAAYDFYLEEQAFDSALALTESMHPLLPTPRVTELEAKCRALWGRNLLTTAQALESESLASQQAAGREQLRLAGDAYSRLAKLRIVTESYTDDLWESAQCYMEGHDYIHAVEVLQEYLNNGTRQRHPQALVDLGEAQLNLGRMDGALAAFEECIEFHPRDAAAYRARLVASQAHAEKGELEQAEALLDANLNGHLAPGSIEWRDSLFTLGRLYHSQGRYEEAIQRLEEAVRRYPDCDQTLQAYYLLAECYRSSAAMLRKQVDSDLVESVKKTNLLRVYDHLTKAGEYYAFVQQALNERQERQQLTEVERKTLRNCYFAVGATWFDLGDYENAIRAYTAASTRYQNSPEALEAYVQIARAYRRTSNPQEARATIRRGEEVLKRLQSQDDFLQATNFNAQQWAELLGWMKTL
jgi:tetratricopeptide (TPR) repeat protein